MAKSSAERQREYRARYLESMEGTGERINTVVSLSAKRSLERLACFYSVMQRAMLARLIAQAGGEVLASLSANMQSAYYDRQLELSE